MSSALLQPASDAWCQALCVGVDCVAMNGIEG